MIVSEVIYGECDDVRSPAFDQADKILARFALQIDQTNCVTGTARCCCDKFEAERFEPKINLRIHQAAGMNSEEFHLLDPLFHRVMFVVRAYEKRRSTAALQDASDEGALAMAATFWSAAMFCRFMKLIAQMISEQPASEY